jgi:hypothetical protein
MDSVHNDSPFWPALNRATYKEIWVVPVSRLLWSLATVGMPARVTGTAPEGAVFREARTGAATKVASGEFSVNLASGDYTLAYGGVTKRMALLSGERYQLALDARRAIDIELSAAKTAGDTVRVEARVRGAGQHTVELLVFNGSADARQKPVSLTRRREQRLTWDLKIASAEKPWAVVAFPDGDRSGRKELSGALRDLPPIE